MEIFRKMFKGVIPNKQPDEVAKNLASQFTEAFNERNYSRVNDLAEDMIEMARRYWEDNDTVSFMYLLSAAKETSYMYSGDRYPRDLVEELIRKQRN